MLQSLPELPVLVYLEAEGCTSLKTVSSSRTTLTQGWDKFCQEIINFFDCINLEHNARSNIMADAQLRILRVASASPKLRETKYDENSSRPLVTIVCPGHEIPNWFSNQYDGSSIIINLPRAGFVMVSWVLLSLWLLLITTAGFDMVWSSDDGTTPISIHITCL
ncbi:disease resistance-like protein DSC1 [Malus sylvestris]|uniref:disease resistance-like protein DSC1 n=1 Tax=Malus sylvestris TaxID=3752 RepID=UPI0021AD1B04|nr:disease resistance-like protein DSC1 [Malus sylvestris]